MFVFLTLYLFLEDVTKPRLSRREVPQEPEPRSFISTSTNLIPSSHRALWSERTADQDWRFGHMPVRVRARRSNPRPHPPGPPHVRREASANMAQQCGPGQQALGNGGGSSPDGGICGITQTDLMPRSSNTEEVQFRIFTSVAFETVPMLV